MVKVKFIAGVDITDGKALASAFEGVEALPVAILNWPEQFPYRPEVKLKMFHTGSHLALKYDVREKCTAALVSADNGQTWTDSCVEFFFQPGGEGRYYNLEATCTGKILMGYRSGRDDAEPSTDEQLAAIGRFPSLGTEPFAERLGDNRWSLILTVPASAYRHSAIETFSGLAGRFNAYKCGDNLSTPHFLSLSPISTPSPDFHRPEFFTEIVFE